MTPDAFAKLLELNADLRSKECYMLSHGQRITAEQIASITRCWSPDEFVSLCNTVVWASARRQGTILPSFTERIYVKDEGIDAEYVELSNEAGNSSHLIGAGWNVLQYKQRDTLAQDRKKLVAGLKNELKKPISNNAQSK